MAQSVTILGTVHQVQGPENSPGKNTNIEDPFYLTLVDRFLHRRDFAFEEASGYGPTKLEGRVRQLLGIGHYLDVDPHPDKREALGIGITGQQILVNPKGKFSDSYWEEFEIEHCKREKHWLKGITSTNFEARVAHLWIPAYIEHCWEITQGGIRCRDLDLCPLSKALPARPPLRVERQSVIRAYHDETGHFRACKPFVCRKLQGVSSTLRLPRLPKLIPKTSMTPPCTLVQFTRIRV